MYLVTSHHWVFVWWEYTTIWDASSPRRWIKSLRTADDSVASPTRLITDLQREVVWYPLGCFIVFGGGFLVFIGLWGTETLPCSSPEVFLWGCFLLIGQTDAPEPANRDLSIMPEGGEGRGGWKWHWGKVSRQQCPRYSAPPTQDNIDFISVLTSIWAAGAQWLQLRQFCWS